MKSPLIQKYALAGGALLLLWLVFRFLLPLAAPFLLAAVLALLAEPLVRVFQQRLHLSRGIASGVGVSITLLLTALLLTTLCAFLLRELGELAGIMPDLESAASDGISSMEGYFLSLAAQTPANVRTLLTRGVENLFSGSSRVLDQVSSRLLDLASNILKGLPDSALSLGTWILASYMTSARLPKIKDLLRDHLPPTWKDRYLPALRQLRHTLTGWLTAQLKLAGITFGILTMGFLLLKISYAPLWAALISLADALPILGTGTILIPWSFVCFLQGDTLQALGLLGIYAVAALMRSILEPRLIGKQLGLDPLITLMAIYAGYHIWGFFGMLLAPLLAVGLTQLLWQREAD